MIDTKTELNNSLELFVGTWRDSRWVEWSVEPFRDVSEQSDEGTGWRTTQGQGRSIWKCLILFVDVQFHFDTYMYVSRHYYWTFQDLKGATNTEWLIPQLVPFKWTRVKRIVDSDCWMLMKPDHKWLNFSPYAKTYLTLYETNLLLTMWRLQLCACNKSFKWVK